MLLNLLFLVVVSGVLYLIWRWVTRIPELPVQPFWNRSKLIACALFAVVYIPFVLVVPSKELNYWGDHVASYGWWSLLLILFPEISREFVSRLTLDGLTTLEVTKGLGWAILSIWLLVTVAIVIGYLF